MVGSSIAYNIEMHGYIVWQISREASDSRKVDNT